MEASPSPSTRSTTLPLVVYSRVRLGLNPGMNALATNFIGLVTTGVAPQSTRRKTQKALDPASV